MEQVVPGFGVKKGLAEMLKGGVIMDVVNADQAKIAEDAGAVAVMALERVPADIRADGGQAQAIAFDLTDGEATAAAVDRLLADGETEWAVLELLVRAEPNLVGQREILTAVWGPTYVTQTNYLRVYLAALRRKLEDDPARPPRPWPAPPLAPASPPPGSARGARSPRGAARGGSASRRTPGAPRRSGSPRAGDGPSMTLRDPRCRAPDPAAPRRAASFVLLAHCPPTVSLS